MINEKKPFAQQLGEYLIDISKLTFGGVVLSAILEISKDKTLILLYGIASTLLMAVSGLIISNIKSKKL
jgi:hypothetical protein